MLRSLCAFRKVLQPKILFSTSTLNELEKPNPLIMQLTAEFENTSSISNAIQNNKELNNINFEEWKSRIYVLKNYQFSDSDCFRMISDYPHLLKIPLEDFKKSVTQWFLADFGLKNIQFALLSQPQLIDINVKEIRKRLPQLRIYFRTSVALCHLVASSPNVMYDDFEILLKKLNYVTKVKKYNMGEVIHSQALSIPLNLIKFRFELLEKCGIYKQDDSPIHKINKYDKTKHKNPPLKDILNLNYKEFIKTAKISDEEYEVCKNLFFEENEEEEEKEENLKDSYHQ